MCPLKALEDPENIVVLQVLNNHELYHCKAFCAVSSSYILREYNVGFSVPQAPDADYIVVYSIACIHEDPW